MILTVWRSDSSDYIPRNTLATYSLMPPCSVGSSADINHSRNLPQHDNTKCAYCIPLSLHRNGNDAQFQRVQQPYPASTVTLRPRLSTDKCLKGIHSASAHVTYSPHPPPCRLVV
ncbi:unnamed protein product [Dicrocoelium dendriticum]|nr:unnamed protein product [Dicrocoelium dendriticum]